MRELRFESVYASQYLLFCGIYRATASELLIPQILACQKCGHRSKTSIDSGALLSSPVPDLIRFNGSASQLESSFIKAKLEEADADLHQIDSEIQQCQALLISLTQRRDQLQHYSQLHKGTLSAIRRFPPEILAKVFHEYGSPSFSRAFRPAQVSKFWRGVAYTTPHLWNSFTIDLEKGSERPDLEANMTQLWLTNSGELPITFSLALLDFYGKPINPELTLISHPCVKLLAENARRWKSVHFDVPRTWLADLSIVGDNLPFLESLKIIPHLSSQESAPLNLVDLVSIAPRLQTLVLGDKVFGITLSSAPWAQLTSCELGGHSISDCYTVLQNSPNLRKCELSASSAGNSDLTHCPPITHYNLESLDINNGNCLEQLLDRLELPNLKSLCEYDWDPAISLYATITSLLHRSGPSLTCLSLTGDNVAEGDELVLCLQQCPSLQTLLLLSCSAVAVDERLLRRLTHFPDETTCCLLPELQSFDVSVEAAFDLESFVAMIESRWRGHGRDCRATDHRKVHQLKKVTISWSFNMSAEEPLADIDSPWLDLLCQIRAEGFIFETENVQGRPISIDEFLFGVYE